MGRAFTAGRGVITVTGPGAHAATQIIVPSTRSTRRTTRSALCATWHRTSRSPGTPCTFGTTFYRPLAVIHLPPVSRILVIDDDQGVRDSMARMLRGAGYAVETAGTGEDGVALA